MKNLFVITLMIFIIGCSKECPVIEEPQDILVTLLNEGVIRDITVDGVLKSTTEDDVEWTSVQHNMYPNGILKIISGEVLEIPYESGSLNGDTLTLKEGQYDIINWLMEWDYYSAYPYEPDTSTTAVAEYSVFTARLRCYIGGVNMVGANQHSTTHVQIDPVDTIVPLAVNPMQSCVVFTDVNNVVEGVGKDSTEIVMGKSVMNTVEIGNKTYYYLYTHPDQPEIYFYTINDRIIGEQLWNPEDTIIVNYYRMGGDYLQMPNLYTFSIN